MHSTCTVTNYLALTTADETAHTHPTPPPPHTHTHTHTHTPPPQKKHTRHPRSKFTLLAYLYELLRQGEDTVPFDFSVSSGDRVGWMVIKQTCVCARSSLAYQLASSQPHLRLAQRSLSRATYFLPKERKKRWNAVAMAATSRQLVAV
jgi:hypothetical protein